MIQQTVVQELGPLEQLGIRLAPSALAEASVAVVIPYVEPRHDRSGGLHEGVLKVLKPGIDERLALELELLGKVGSHLDERCEELQIPRLDYEELFQQIREKLAHEVRLDEEQRNLAEAKAVYAAEPRVHIPALLEYCTPRITAMERIHGVKVTDSRLDECRDRRRLVEAMVRALISGPIFSRDARAMFHGDPHAGNLFLTDDGRLAILDWSLVGSLDDRQRMAFFRMILGAMALHPGRIATVLERLSESNAVDRLALLTVVEESVKRIRHGAIPGLDWLTGLLDAAVQTAGLRVAADLMLFRKSLHTLERVIAEVGQGVIRADNVLLTDFVRHFASEWPRRWVAEPDSRDFATRLSNLDLLKSLLDAPWAVTRFWTGRATDWLRTRPSCVSGFQPDCRAESLAYGNGRCYDRRQTSSTLSAPPHVQEAHETGVGCDVANG